VQLRIYYRDDYKPNFFLDDLAAVDYRLVEKIPLIELGDSIESAALELVKMSRKERWHSLDGGRRPIRCGDILVFNMTNYLYHPTIGVPVGGGSVMRLLKLPDKVIK
jgi:hypothetical protein